ncbi:HAD-IIIA family hydrolase [Caulobacter sp.]|uniref:HAD-IIIA family hydrolase n=1 Tax=Caulobacter sp. TaxID=78 RepID=UPI002B4A491D|nr:HAD-IIIA family hydrolase [Caulobacter sp.]HJV41811.1 HAD-IIIA family hydrolase [Caulobacter sp.]
MTAARPARPAVFLDRDGVLNRVVMRDGKAASPRTIEELEIEPDAPAALATLKAAGYLLLVVTNQPDVRRGLMKAEALDALHARLAAALPIDDIAACLHDNADRCACRKPKPGLVLDLAARHGADLGRSWLIGDQDRDIACGKAAGCRTILLGRDYNSGTGAGADHVAATLSQSLLTILSTT